MWRLLMILMAGLQAAASTGPIPTTIQNADFETIAPSGFPAPWQFHNSPKAGYRFGSVGSGGGHVGRLSYVGPMGGADKNGASANQEIDATRFRGRFVRLSARVRVDKPGVYVGLTLRVLRPATARPGFADAMLDRPIKAGGWTSQTLDGYVAPDAEKIRIGFAAAGDADVTVDDFAITEITPAPPSKIADDYLAAAIRLIRATHINTARADWDKITAEARSEIGGARTTADTYSAIREILFTLGERHSFLLPPAGRVATGSGSTPTAPLIPEMPAWRLVDGKFGLVTLPRLNTLGPAGTAIGKRYAEALKDALQTLDGQKLCGWIVDLRPNEGGNMWPMLQGLDPLLGAGPFGYFVDPRGHIQSWVRVQAEIAPVEEIGPARRPGFALRQNAAPVAILIGPRTASSGEMTAVSLIGRPGTRTFGAPSGGFTTGNRPIALSDGATLILTEVYIRDRTGRNYVGPIVPDEVTDPVDAEVVAKRWLDRQCRE